VKGTVAKLAGKLTKACSVQANLGIADLAAPNGLGLSAQIQRCTDLNDGVTPLPLDQCFGAQAFCEGGYLIERQVPRARELADLLNVVIPGTD
jgi:hypothetical protein